MSVFGRSGTIYDAPPSQTIPLATGAPDLSQQLGGSFQAGWVRVNNPTNQALYLPDADDFVPGGVTGAVLKIQPTDVARASWTIPVKFNLVQPAPQAGVAQLTFYNKDVPMLPQAGTPSIPPQPFPGSIVQTSTQLASGSGPGSFLNATVTPTPGMQLQLIGIGLRFPVGAFPTVVLTGVQSGFAYYNGVLVGTVYITPQAADTSFTISAGGAAGTSVTLNGLLNAVLVSTSPSSGPASWPGRFDGQANAHPAVGSKATVTLLANATKRWVASSFQGSMAQSSGAATQRNLNLIDGASGGTSILWDEQLALTATANTVDRGTPHSNEHYANSAINTALTLEFDAAVAGTAQVASLGAYLQ